MFFDADKELMIAAIAAGRDVGKARRDAHVQLDDGDGADEWIRLNDGDVAEIDWDDVAAMEWRAVDFDADDCVVWYRAAAPTAATLMLVFPDVAAARAGDWDDAFQAMMMYDDRESAWAWQWPGRTPPWAIPMGAPYR